MQANRGDLLMQDECVFTPIRRQKGYQCLREGSESPGMSVDRCGSDLPKPRNLTSQLQTVNVDIDAVSVGFSIKLLGEDQNVDMENCSTQASSLESSQVLTRESSTASWTSQTNFSAKFAAPMKQVESNKFKDLLKGINRREFSGKSFLQRLNEAEEWGDDFTLLPEQDEDMSLEQHLEALTNWYVAEDEITQNENNFSEDLELKIVPKSYFGKGIQLILQSQKRSSHYYGSYSDRVSITMPPNIKHSDLCKKGSLLRQFPNGEMLCVEFFQKFSKEYWDKGLNIVVKVNDEPIFPAKVTLDYLCRAYQNNNAKVKYT